MTVMAVLQGRVNAIRVGAALLVLWLCGPFGPLVDRFFVERLPDHGHLYAVGYHLHGFQLAYAGFLPAGHNLALHPDGAVMTELKAAAAVALGPVQLLCGPIRPLATPLITGVRIHPETVDLPAQAVILLPDPPPRLNPFGQPVP